MLYAVICSVAFCASVLTFFSGFGLGTLLLPAFAVFFAIETAVALTAVVHLLNGFFKVSLLLRYVDVGILMRFGLPAIVAAYGGAWTLLWLADVPPVVEYSLAGRTVAVAPAKVTVGVLLLLFSCADLSPRFRQLSFPPRLLPVGGALRGFFGGLAGMQGALRSAFLVKAGLPKEAYVATGSAIGVLIDVARLSVYAPLLLEQASEANYFLLAAAVVAAFVGVSIGNHLLRKVTMRWIEGLVAMLRFAVGCGLISGLL